MSVYFRVMFYPINISLPDFKTQPMRELLIDILQSEVVNIIIVTHDLHHTYPKI